jgi:hypothetical protein
MHAHGRTLRQWGDLRLVAVSGAGGHERYYVAQDEEAPLGTFADLAAAVACFEAVRAAGITQSAGAAPGAAPAGARNAAQAGAGARRAEGERLRQAEAAGVTDLTAYRLRRQRRPRGDAPKGPSPSGPEAP